MNKVILRFYILKDDDYIELVLDDRISFNDNFKLLKQIINIDYKYILDYSSFIPLKLDIPLKKYNFAYLTRLLIL